MSTLQASDSADDAEERLRISLSRIGTQKNQIRPARPHQLTQPVRRRFVRDGEVPTEYAGRGHDAAASSEADEALSALRAGLAAEQAAREEAEQALAAVKAANRGLQTRVGHMELELEELRARAVRAAEAETVRAAEAAEAIRLLELRPARPVRAAKPIAHDEDDNEDDADGPQPVKWWLKG